MQGAAGGGGLGLACAADFRVASSATRFHANFSALGFHHGFALSVTLPRIVGAQRAKDLLLTSRRVGGEEGFALGLVDRLTEAGQERAGAVALAQEIAAAGPLAVRSISRTLDGRIGDDVIAALEHEPREQQRLWRTADSRARVASSLERRSARRAADAVENPAGTSTYQEGPTMTPDGPPPTTVPPAAGTARSGGAR